ncbi:cytochrome c oxidase subunit I [Salimicrobium halophilum]|uniref:Cytochrome c oxidase subunit 1 n=1 Tax=Salimicrobium halophilum TaxID=86666 RepID=A0A1G8TXI8_9BACI|nr:cbb3-type cytochrome c oxidase subunit I [Salimicrobium halophilum]SDJ46104.1 cytochrome c oxidase subunit 1 [Salimicrobium halophilum]
MNLPVIGKVPSDVVVAWMVMLILGALTIIFLSKKKKWSLLWEYMRTTHHRKIGTMYIMAAILFFFRGGMDALLIRTQLAVPQNDFWVYQGDKYNELFTFHGTVMIFFVAMPLLIGLMNVAIPLQIGANDLAFPYLNAVSFWLFFAGAMIFNMSFFFNAAPNAGWTAYAPLSTDAYTAQVNNNYYIFGLQVSGMGTILTAINMIVTIFRLRAPGMKMTRMPLFPWSTLVTSVLILVAFPVLTIALTLLMFDRYYGTHFFMSEMGDPVYWQHLFWIFGHPEVYILIIPAFGIFSDIISHFSRQKVYGYKSMVGAIVLIAMLGFMVWAHHMFTVGLGAFANTFFAITTMMIAVPTGIKVFNWLFTMRHGAIRMTTPMLFSLGFIPTFVMGGVTGVMLAVAAADYQYHDTYFVVAHFHYTMVGGTVLGAFAGIYYWFPKMTGKKLDDSLGKWHFWLFATGFHLTFLPQHFAGLNGMPRRVYTYLPEDGVAIYNGVSTAGAFLMGISMLFLLYNLYKTAKSKEKAAADAWLGDGRTLEWTVASPAPEHPFEQVPYVKSVDPFWFHKRRIQNMPMGANPRPSPVSVKTIQPLLFVLTISMMSIAFIYHWIWVEIIFGLLVLMFFLLRTLTDERESVYRKEGEA